MILWKAFSALEFPTRLRVGNNGQWQVLSYVTFPMAWQKFPGVAPPPPTPEDRQQLGRVTFISINAKLAVKI
jgi:hypothetical protein